MSKCSKCGYEEIEVGNKVEVSFLDNEDSMCYIRGVVKSKDGKICYVNVEGQMCGITYLGVEQERLKKL